MVLWRTGGLAFSPGRLSAKNTSGMQHQGFSSHADFESDCSHCHQPLKMTQDALCLDCHQDISTQIGQLQGTHGMIQNVHLCFSCHSDHHGEEYDLIQAAYAAFDHSRTDFTLIRHQVDYDTSLMECMDCHQDDRGFTFSEAACALCHSKADLAFIVQHAQDYGAECTSCHDGQDSLVDFDHMSTGFPLEGTHFKLDCSNCHAQEQVNSAGGKSAEDALALFKGLPTSCTQCHADANPHLGMFSADCASCHTPHAWAPAMISGIAFEHQAQTGFSLTLHQHDNQGSPLTCNDCHFGSLQGFDQQACAGCHFQGDEGASFMLEHQEKFGSDCTACHDGIDRMLGFVHDQIFELDGQHAEIACQDCHAEKIFSGTPRECSRCHEEPAIHAGYFGVRCQLCHTAQAWAPALLHEHTFPLDHGEDGDQPCTRCHTSRYDEYTCYECHEHNPVATEEQHKEEGLTPAKLAACANCHPAGLKEEN